MRFDGFDRKFSNDGRSTDSDSLAAIGPAYQALGVPIHVGDSLRADIGETLGERAAVIETAIVMLTHLLRVFAAIVFFERDNPHVSQSSSHPMR